MNVADIELRHILDVDGQLLGIDAEVVDTATLLRRVRWPADSQLWLVRAGEPSSHCAFGRSSSSAAAPM